MSSATSIKSVGGHPAVAGLPTRPESADRGLRPWHFFVLASLMAATAAVIMSRQTTPEHLILISLIMAAAGFAAAGFYRMLAPLVADDTLTETEPLSDRTRAALEREKMLTLRSIKELEFDRAMGKLSDKDFEEISARLRARAVGLMKELDERRGGGYRALIERELDSRLATRPAPAADASSAVLRCAGCGTENDADAAFCKRCGARIAAEAPQP